MYSVVHNGKVLKFKYKRHTKMSWSFYVGDILLGTLWKRPFDNSWTALSINDDDGYPIRIEGFKNRLYAAEYLIMCNRIG